MEQPVDEDDRCMRDINNCKVDYDPIGLYADNVNFEIKGALLSNLPKFRGFAGEDPHRHLKTMYTVCSTMKPPTVNLGDVMKRAFHFTLEDKAKEWLYTLPTHFTVLTWDQLQSAFLEEYFPDSKTSQLKKDITSVKQFGTESMYEYWRRFITMLAQCPHHSICKNDLVNSFFEGLLPHHKPTVHAAAGGYLRDLSPNAAWDLLQKLSTNDHHSGDERRNTSSSSSNDKNDILAEIAALGSRMEKRMNLMERELYTKKVNAVDNFSERSGGGYEQVEDCAAFHQERSGGYQKRDPYSNTYNPGWRDHPNFSWKGNHGNQGQYSNNQGNQGQYSNNQGNYQAYNQGQMSQGVSSSSNSKNDDLSMIMKGIAGINSRLDQEKSAAEAKFNKLENGLQTVFSKLNHMETKHENLNSYVTQMANNLSEQQAKSGGSIPSNVVINPKSVNAITLRSGKELEPGKVRFSKIVEEEPVDEEIEVQEPSKREPTESTIRSEGSQEEKLKTRANVQPVAQEVKCTNCKKPKEKGSSSSSKDDEVRISELPFPASYFRGKKQCDEKEANQMYEMFSKLCVNLPLIELVKKIPKYGKFLKDLCTKKRKYKANDRIQLGPSVSAIFKPHLPVKCRDPGAYIVPCIIGDTHISHALLDPGAAINVMPTSVYNNLRLNIQALKSTPTVLGLADRTLRYPKGILEDVLVQIKDLVFPADFYVLDMSNESKSDNTLILGRPFLLTAETIINMKKGTITMGIGDEHEITFDLSETMHRGFEDCSYLGVNLIESIEDLDDLPENIPYEISWYDLIEDSEDVFTCLSAAHSVSINACTDVACVSCLEIDNFLHSQDTCATTSCTISELSDEISLDASLEKGIFDCFAGLSSEDAMVQVAQVNSSPFLVNKRVGQISDSVGIEGVHSKPSPTCTLITKHDLDASLVDTTENASLSILDVGNDKGSGELICTIEQRTPSQSHKISDIGQDNPIGNYSIISYDKAVNANESLKQILSCDLPPDLEPFNDQDNNLTAFPFSSMFPSGDCKDEILCSNNHQLDFTNFTSQAQEDFTNLPFCLVSTEGKVIDFLGCDSYLESLVPKMPSQYSKSLHVCIIGLNTAVSPIFVLQNHARQGYAYKPYPLDPLPVDPEPPLRTSIVRGAIMKKVMFLIRDENFSYKSLRRFKQKVVSFFTCFLFVFV